MIGARPSTGIIWEVIRYGKRVRSTSLDQLMTSAVPHPIIAPIQNPLAALVSVTHADWDSSGKLDIKWTATSWR